jgi:ZIP family zinc transporter
MDAQTFAGLILPGLATVAGGLAVLAMPHPGDRLMATLLGFTGGIMLAAAVFSLLVPALELGSLGEVLAGFAVGSFAIAVFDILLPHAHPRFVERGRGPGRAHCSYSAL